MDLVAHTLEKRLVDQRSRLEVGAEDDHRFEGRADRHAGTRQREIVDPPLQGHDQAVEQGAWRGVLAPEVIEQKDAPIGFEVDGRLVIAHQRVERG